MGQPQGTSSPPPASSAPASSSSATAAAPATSAPASSTAAPATSPSVPTTTPASSAPDLGTTTAAAAPGSDAPEGDATPPWSPNYKFKVQKLDNPEEQEEHEIDEWLRESIKDPETEKKAKELFERSKGLDVVKKRYQTTREELQTVKQQRAQEARGFNVLNQMLTKKDFGRFFDNVKVDRKDIFAWCIQEAEYANLPQEQKDIIDARRAAEQRAESSTLRAEEVETRYKEQATQIRRVELNMALARPEVSSFAERFDAQYGNSGAFQNELIRMGRHVWATEERDLSVDEAVKMVMNHYGRFLGAPASAPQDPASASAGQPNVVAPSAPRQVPVIPRVAGGTTSPTRAPVKNLEELKKLSNEASARLARATQ